jgi:2,5-dioxopentanoate dehydrogenase
MLTGTSFLGASRGAVSTTGTAAVNPATGAALEPLFHWASPTEVQQAVRLAEVAFGDTSRRSGAARGVLLRRIADLIQENADPLVERALAETGLPSARLKGEIGRTTGQLRLFAAEAEAGRWVDARIDHADPQRQPVPKPDVRSMLRPLGPVAVFSSSNFPFAFSVAGGDTASALAAGCPVIVKAHQGHLGTSELTAALIQQAVRDCGWPEGTFSLLFGTGREVGIALVTHPAVQAVGFTGSGSGGRALMDAAAARPQPIPVFAEMGSINPVFILPGALAARAEALATGLHGSATLGVGQFCTNPGLVIIPETPETEAFLTAYATLMAGTAAGTMLTPGICREYQNGLNALQAHESVSTLGQAATPEGSSAALGAAAVLVTTVDAFLSQPALQTEVFGPSTLIVRGGTAADFPRIARVLHGQLTATLHATAEDLVGASELISVLEGKAGRLVLNAFPTGVEVCAAMHHGGPYPACADARSTSVGTRAISRFGRPVCFQGFPTEALPPELQEENPLGIVRLVDGVTA